MNADDDDNDIHYLRHVTALGERHAVVAHAAIRARNGMKLVNAGTRIDMRLLDKLAAHKILPPIDECLAAENQVTSATLQADAAEIADSTPCVGRMLTGEQLAETLAVLGRIPLPPALAFKLTVARDQRPALYRHSLQVALLAAMIARQQGAGAETQMEAAAAGTVHDIGLLHIDPAILDRQDSLTEEQRRHLYSHPVLAHLALGTTPQWSGIAQAVLEHHERRDGSGYPLGRSGKQLCELGQLLAVAEVGAGVLFKANDPPPGRRALEVVLRMNANKLGAGHANALLAIIANGRDAAPNEPVAMADCLPALVGITVAINHWRSLRGRIPDTTLIAFMDDRIERLARALADTGVDLDYWSTFNNDLEPDASSQAEIVAITREAQWQLRAIVQELQRKWGAQMADAIRNWIAALDADLMLPR